MRQVVSSPPLHIGARTHEPSCASLSSATAKLNLYAFSLNLYTRSANSRTLTRLSFKRNRFRVIPKLNLCAF